MKRFLALLLMSLMSLFAFSQQMDNSLVIEQNNQMIQVDVDVGSSIILDNYNANFDFASLDRQMYPVNAEYYYEGRSTEVRQTECISINNKNIHYYIYLYKDLGHPRYEHYSSPYVNSCHQQYYHGTIAF